MRVSRGARRESCSLNPPIRNKRCKKKQALFSRRDCSGRVAPRSDVARFESAKTRLKPKELDS